MNQKQRILLYLLVCLPVRIIPIIILFFTKKLNILISILYLFMGLSFLYRTTTFYPGQKGVFGGLVWWQNLRLIHSIIYVFTAWLIYKNRITQAKRILIADLLLGFFGFIYQYLL